MLHLVFSIINCFFLVLILNKMSLTLPTKIDFDLLHNHIHLVILHRNTHKPFIHIFHMHFLPFLFFSLEILLKFRHPNLGITVGQQLELIEDRSISIGCILIDTFSNEGFAKLPTPPPSSSNPSFAHQAPSTLLVQELETVLSGVITPCPRPWVACQPYPLLCAHPLHLLCPLPPWVSCPCWIPQPK